jgi:hypothetical protein
VATDRRKPTGTSGPVVLTGGQGAEFQQTVFPAAKDEIEQFIVSGALATAAQTHPAFRALYGQPAQNEENNYDFTLRVEGRTESLELAEFVFPGGHESSGGEYLSGDYADLMMALIKKKARKYGIERRDRVHLLIYTTDWRVLAGQNALNLLREYALRKRHAFKTIAYYASRDAEGGVFEPLYPAPTGTQRMGWLREHEMRATRVKNYDPKKIRMSPDGQSFTINP